MAVALLAHTDLFRAGVALAGAYNRTLTPVGFQQEERTLWQAPEVYRAMSPLLDADRITEPLLLIHGQEDSHTATRPEQSEALYEALRFLERPARLVLLPHEGHRPRGRESVLHLLWEMDRWLTEHLSVSP
jgi:dipeptidyl aminopeptidase/acylaminoacyl peptidase